MFVHSFFFGAVLIISARATNETLARSVRVVDGKIVNDGLYIIQSEENTRAVISVAGEDFGTVRLAGEPLNSVTASKWGNGDNQKWNVNIWGKMYYHLTPKSKSINAITYKIYMRDFPMPNIWEILPVETGKYWQIKKYRGKCLQFQGMDRLIAEEKCDSAKSSQMWHFHMLDPNKF